LGLSRQFQNILLAYWLALVMPVAYRSDQPGNNRRDNPSNFT